MSNITAFLSMIASSEGTLAQGAKNGYDVIVGSRAGRAIFFNDFSDHPRVTVQLSAALFSTAAGRYQILARYFDAYKAQLRLADFSPASQDAIAQQMIHECGATDDVNAGRFADAVKKCASRWASLPGAGYGQNENTLAALQAAYVTAGGMVA